MTLIGRLKVGIARTLCHPLLGQIIGRYFGRVVPNRGCKIDTRHPSISPSIVASLFWGFYESAESRLVRSYLPLDLDVVELGASIGAVSAQIARRLGPGRRLISVEANPALLDLLATNVRRNAPQVRHEVVHAAISYFVGKTVALTLGKDTLGSALASTSHSRRIVEVPSITFRRLLDSRDISDFALVSDIEGAEALVFSEDSAALERCRLMIIELHPTIVRGRPISVEDLRAQIQALGFSLLARRGPVCAFRQQVQQPRKEYS
jgi:FkbM family methyltransferase